MADINEFFDNGGQLLTFMAGEEKYGFHILDVTDIIEIPHITLIPTTPPYVLGLMNLRGKAVPVIDFRRKLGLPEYDYDSRSCIIVLEINTLQCGVRVDRISDVERVVPADIARSPAAESLISAFIIRSSEDRISVLNTEKLVR